MQDTRLKWYRRVMGIEQGYVGKRTTAMHVREEKEWNTEAKVNGLTDKRLSDE